MDSLMKDLNNRQNHKFYFIVKGITLRIEVLLLCWRAANSLTCNQIWKVIK